MASNSFLALRSLPRLSGANGSVSMNKAIITNLILVARKTGWMPIFAASLNTHTAGNVLYAKRSSTSSSNASHTIALFLFWLYRGSGAADMRSAAVLICIYFSVLCMDSYSQVQPLTAAQKIFAVVSLHLHLPLHLSHNPHPSRFLPPPRHPRLLL